jgi:hypothetical protein
VEVEVAGLGSDGEVMLWDGVGEVFSSVRRRAVDDSGACWAFRIDCRHDEHIDGLVSRDNEVFGGIVVVQLMELLTLHRDVSTGSGGVRNI